MRQAVANAASGGDRKSRALPYGMATSSRSIRYVGLWRGLSSLPGTRCQATATWKGRSTCAQACRVGFLACRAHPIRLRRPGKVALHHSVSPEPLKAILLGLAYRADLRRGVPGAEVAADLAAPDGDGRLRMADGGLRSPRVPPSPHLPVPPPVPPVGVAPGYHEPQPGR